MFSGQDSALTANLQVHSGVCFRDALFAAALKGTTGLLSNLHRKFEGEDERHSERVKS